MGLYLRKSVSVGPFRFNLSKSGVGVSAGVKGFRVGTGPRGNYVHMGRNGIYYRATLPPSGKQPSHPQARNVTKTLPPPATHEPLQEIESADVSQIVDSSSRELLQELNEKQKKTRLLPFVGVGFAVLLLIGMSSAWPTWILLTILLSGVLAASVAHSRDVLAKTVVLFYDFDPELEKAYKHLHDWAEQLAACAGAWHIAAEGRVHDRKYHAGASSLVRRNRTFIRKSEPPYLKTNIETIALGVGRQTLHFFPDRVLVYEKNSVGGVSYQHLRVDVRPSRFIEDGAVPRDAKVVDYTWKFVNKSGGPDKRFKDNRQLPICLYDEITLTSSTGLNEVVQVSRTDIAEHFQTAIAYLGSKIPRELTS